MQIAEAKDRFSEVVRSVEQGEPMVITRGARREEVAVVVSIRQWRKAQERRFGELCGKVTVTFADDWQVSDEELLGLPGSN
jgi:prevent-host-death family protein